MSAAAPKTHRPDGGGARGRGSGFAWDIRRIVSPAAKGGGIVAGALHEGKGDRPCGPGGAAVTSSPDRCPLTPSPSGRGWAEGLRLSPDSWSRRSEEHTSELQSLAYL